MARFVVAAAVLALVLLLARLQLVVLPVFIAMLLTTILAPPARALERRGLPRSLATTTVFVGFAALLFGLLAAVAAPLGEEFADLGPTISEGVDDLEQWLVDGPLDRSPEQVDRYREQLRDGVQSLLDRSSGGAVAAARTAGEVLAGLVLTLVLAFFFVKDARLIQRWGMEHLPERHRGLARELGGRSWRVLAAYLRGAALIGAVEAVIIGATLFLVGGRLVVPVMILTFLAAFFPIVGAVAAGVTAVLVAMVTAGPGAALVVGVVALVVQQLDNDLLAPLVYGRTVQLHPVVVLLVLTAGAALGGLAGAFVAVPTAAVVVAVGGVLWRRAHPADRAPAEEDRTKPRVDAQPA